MRDVPLFWKSGDAGRGIDHRLLAHSNEASDRPVEVQDQKYDRPDQQSNEINGQPLTPLIEPARVARECAGGRGNAKKHQYDDVRYRVAKRRKMVPLVVDHLIERLNE